MCRGFAAPRIALRRTEGTRMCRGFAAPRMALRRTEGTGMCRGLRPPWRASLVADRGRMDAPCCAADRMSSSPHARAHGCAEGSPRHGWHCGEPRAQGCAEGLPRHGLHCGEPRAQGCAEVCDRHGGRL
jgi:hypothetical protein